MGNVEEWLPVVGSEQFYEVSDHGRVRSLDRVVVRRDGSSSPLRGRVLSVTEGKGEYQKVDLRPGGFRKVHRLVLEAFVGPAPEGKPFGLHADGDPSNNRLENLRWGSQTDNMQDMRVHGRNWFSNRTDCPQGHPYDEENTYRNPAGRRICRSCRRARREKGLPPEDPQHGTLTGYATFGCGCESCKLAGRKYRQRMKEQRKRRNK